MTSKNQHFVRNESLLTMKASADPIAVKSVVPSSNKFTNSVIDCSLEKKYSQPSLTQPKSNLIKMEKMEV